MLPPVAALSDTALSQFNQSQYLPTSSRVQIGTARADASAHLLTSSAAIANDRRDVLSLSGQLQLAQGLSSVAETVGGILKLARHEGETLTDYADRLAETIAALPPAERVALQRVLMQIIKGVTLRLLVDILKNPFGPEATRLSLQLETDAATERDPVTKLIVTSYRQNDGSGGLIGPPSRPFLATNGAQMTGQTAAQATALATASLPGGATAAGPLPSAAPAVPFETDTPPQVLATHSGQAGALAVPAESEEANRQGATAEHGLPTGQARALETTGSLAARTSDSDPDGKPEALGRPATDGPGAARANASEARLTSPPLRDDVTYDGPALARQSSQRVASIVLTALVRTEQMLADQASPGGSRPLTAAGATSPMGRVSLTGTETAALTSDRYAAIFAGDSFGDEFSFVPAPQGQTSPSSVATVAQTIAGDGEATIATQMTTARTPSTAETPAAGAQMMGAPSPEEVAIHASESTIEQAGYRPDAHSAAALRSTTANAFVPPFVPYPVSSSVQKGKADLVRAVEAVNEDGRSGRRKQGRGQEDQDGQDEAGEESRDEADLSAADAAQAEAAARKPDSRNRPTAHLSNDRQGEAQDFYQRLAAW